MIVPDGVASHERVSYTTAIILEHRDDGSVRVHRTGTFSYTSTHLVTPFIRAVYIAYMEARLDRAVVASDVWRSVRGIAGLEPFIDALAPMLMGAREQSLLTYHIEGKPIIQSDDDIDEAAAC